MNKELKKAFCAIKDNRVVVFDTNLKEFVDKLNTVEPESRNYMFYYRFFADNKVLEFTNSKAELYVLQQIV